MSRAARRWIAPYWRARNPSIADPIDSALIYVLNPSGHSSATVKRQWYARDGSLLAEGQSVVSPSNTVPFSPTVDGGNWPSGFEVQGWLRITSNHPVCPWGETPFRTATGQPDGHTNMTFYREDSGGDGPHSRLNA
jgi:hypothetical protein